MTSGYPALRVHRRGHIFVGAVGVVLAAAGICQRRHPVVKPALASGGVILSELAAQPMRYAAHPKGVPAYITAITLTVPSNLDISRCDHGQRRTWGTGAHTLLAPGPGQRDLIWTTYLGLSGKTLIVDATTFPNTPTRLVRQVDAILASVGARGSCGLTRRLAAVCSVNMYTYDPREGR